MLMSDEQIKANLAAARRLLCPEPKKPLATLDHQGGRYELWTCADLPAGTPVRFIFMDLLNSSYANAEALRYCVTNHGRGFRDDRISTSNIAKSDRVAIWKNAPSKPQPEFLVPEFEVYQRQNDEMARMAKATGETPQQLKVGDDHRKAWSEKLRELQRQQRHKERYAVVCEPVWLED